MMVPLTIPARRRICTLFPLDAISFTRPTVFRSDVLKLANASF